MFENEVYEMDQDFVPKPGKYILHNLEIKPVTGQFVYNDVLVQVVEEELEFQYYKEEADFQPNLGIFDDYHIKIIHQWYDGVHQPYIGEISYIYEIRERRVTVLSTDDESIFFNELKTKGLNPFTSQNIFISPPRIFINGMNISPEAKDFLVTHVTNYLYRVPLKETYANILNVIKAFRSKPPSSIVPKTNAERAFSLASNPPGRMMEFLGRGGKKTNKRYRRKNKSRRRKHKSHRRKH